MRRPFPSCPRNAFISNVTFFLATTILLRQAQWRERHFAVCEAESALLLSPQGAAILRLPNYFRMKRLDSSACAVAPSTTRRLAEEGWNSCSVRFPTEKGCMLDEDTSFELAEMARKYSSDLKRRTISGRLRRHIYPNMLPTLEEYRVKAPEQNCSD